MWEAIKKYLWSILEKIAGFFLDLLTWLVEFLYFILSSIYEFFITFFGEILLTLLNAFGEHIPTGLIDNVLTVYEWLEYINKWVPIEYGIKLLLAYFTITLLFSVYKFVRSLIPGLG